MVRGHPDFTRLGMSDEPGLGSAISEFGLSVGALGGINLTVEGLGCGKLCPAVVKALASIGRC